MKRLLFALIPVVLLATASFALPDNDAGGTMSLSTGVDVAREGSETSTASVTVAQVPPAPVTQPQPQQAAQQPAVPAQPAPAPAVTEEAVPPLVVDKTQLVEAAALLTKAIEQANLAVSADRAKAQQMYIQETINLLAGSANVHFKASGQATATYTGVGPLLSQALTARESAEALWVAALYQRDSELYLAGPGGALPPATVTTKIGTDGLRPEQQANLLVDRAILQATEALRLAAMPAEADRDENRPGVIFTGASTEAADLMRWVSKQLEVAQKIVQIALNR